MSPTFDTATIKPFAPWWKWCLVLAFGEKWTSQYGTTVLTGYRWRGIIYVWSVSFEEMHAVKGASRYD